MRFLFTLLVALLVSVLSSSLDIEIDVDFNPCSLKSCGNDEECRVIDHAELLEIPVAACVKTNMRPTEGGQCKSQNVGSNILNCKSLAEWTLIGQTQCSLEEGDELELNAKSIKTKYVCHQKTGSEKKYLSVEFECCRKETPSVMTVVATPATTKVSDRPKEDGWTQESPTDNGDLEKTTSSVSSTQISTATEPNDDTQVAVGDSYLQPLPGDSNNADDEPVDYVENLVMDDRDNDEEEEEDTSDGVIIIFSIGFAVACCIMILISLIAYVRYLMKKQQAKSGYNRPTALVNTNCDVIYTVPTYPEDKQLLTKNMYY